MKVDQRNIQAVMEKAPTEAWMFEKFQFCLFLSLIKDKKSRTFPKAHIAANQYQEKWNNLTTLAETAGFSAPIITLLVTVFKSVSVVPYFSPDECGGIPCFVAQNSLTVLNTIHVVEPLLAVILLLVSLPVNLQENLQLIHILLCILDIVRRFAFLPILNDFYNHLFQFIITVWFDEEPLNRS